VPIDFPDLYTFERMKDLPRYSKALALRAERGSLNLASTQNKMQQVLIYSRQLQQMLVEAKTSVIPARHVPGITPAAAEEIREIGRFKDDISMDYPEEKKKMIEELFWMIEEYKVSLFAQELKTPYPVSPKKLNRLVEEIEKAFSYLVFVTALRFFTRGFTGFCQLPFSSASFTTSNISFTK
jgi:ATP-dependent helicase HrpA